MQSLDDDVRVTPFLDAGLPASDTASVTADREAEPDAADESFGSAWEGFSSPFDSADRLESMVLGSDLLAEEFVSFSAELHDREFDREVHLLVDELSRLYERQTRAETSPAHAVRMLELQVEPLSADFEGWVDRLAERLASEDEETLTGERIERMLAEHDDVEENAYAPQTEEFFKRLKRLGRKLKNKAKKTIRRAVAKAKKAAGKVAGKVLARLWSKLKRIGRSLLSRVLNAAIGKLPAALQPIARKLARRFVKEVDEEIYTFRGATAPGTGIETLQRELDAQLAYLVLAEDEAALELSVAEYELAAERMADDGVAELDRARERFVRRVNALEEGEDPTPAVEEFVPAVLAGLRLGIRVVGRRRVVRFLARYLARLIRRWVGRKHAAPLARAITDLGLRLARLETAEEAMLAGEAVAATLEETVRRVAELDDHVLDSEELLEGFVLDAFESAASANLPPVLSEEVYRKRPALRQSARVKGLWVLHPRGGRRRRYKKFTRVLERELTPQMTEMVRTWRGAPLSSYLKSRHGIYGRPVRVRIHAYEAIPGTVLSRIARHEGEARDDHADEGLHPLTEAAAGVLLDEPGLGREVAEEFLAEPHHIAVGQRLYLLEIDPATKSRESLVAMDGSRRCCDAHLVLDFVRREARMALFLDESVAQELADRIERGTRPGLLVRTLRDAYERGIRRAFTDGADHQLRIIHGAVLPTEPPSSLLSWVPRAHLSMLRRALVTTMDRVLLAELSRSDARFVAAARAAPLGVRLSFRIVDPAALSTLGRLLAGEAVRVRQPMPPADPLEATLHIRAGFAGG